MILAGDQDAEKMAYGMATNAWKEGERGFRDMERDEVVAHVERGLIHASSNCPSCDRN
jgi:hypothetical protein